MLLFLNYIYIVYYLLILNWLAPTCVILCFNDDETTTFCEYIVLQTYFVKCVAHDWFGRIMCVFICKEKGQITYIN